jgi:signal peptidase
MKRILLLICIGVITAVISYWLVLTLKKNLTYKSYVVQSGSMEPSVRVGDVIIIHTQQSYEKTDVITFKDAQKHTVTHRILDKKQTTPPLYLTKGDANQAVDTEEVAHSSIIGKVILVIPKIGYLIQFIRTPWGLILTIFVPAIILLSEEIKSLYKSIK